MLRMKARYPIPITSFNESNANNFISAIYVIMYNIENLSHISGKEKCVGLLKSQPKKCN